MPIRALIIGLILTISSNATALHRSDEDVRIGITSVMSRSDINTINQLTSYLSARVERKVWPVFTSSHTEMSRLLTSGAVDFAWIDPGMLLSIPDIEIIAAPGYQDGPYYFSYMVIRSDRAYEDIAQLKDKPFAFGDLQSFSGTIAPKYELSRQGYQPERFFRPLIYVDDHINVIKAVNDGFVEGGTISSIVFTQLTINAPALVENLKVLQQFGPYPAPPIVASTRTQPYVIEIVKNAFLSLHEHEDGIVVLKKLGMEQFHPVTPKYYMIVEQINNALHNGSSK